MKNILIIIVIMISTLYCYADGQFRLTGGTCIDSIEFPEIFHEPGEFSEFGETKFWGIGWEVIVDHLGFGGNYYTNFNEDTYHDWSVSWYSEVLFVSYHFFDKKSFIDPFVQAGAGCSGSVLMKASHYPHSENELALSLFPFVSSGLAFKFDNFLAGFKVNYIPEMNPIPFTDIDLYSLKTTQLHIFTGISF